MGFTLILTAESPVISYTHCWVSSGLLYSPLSLQWSPILTSESPVISYTHHHVSSDLLYSLLSLQRSPILTAESPVISYTHCSVSSDLLYSPSHLQQSPILTAAHFTLKAFGLPASVYQLNYFPVHPTIFHTCCVVFSYLIFSLAVPSIVPFPLSAYIQLSINMLWVQLNLLVAMLLTKEIVLLVNI